MQTEPVRPVSVAGPPLRTDDPRASSTPSPSPPAGALPPPWASLAGDRSGLDQVFVECYEDLLTIARSRLRRGAPDVLLETSALVHECWLRLAGLQVLSLEDRHHFLAYAARVIRSLVLDAWRARQSARHGGLLQQITLDTALAEQLAAGESALEPLAAALNELATLDPRLATVVELRYFAGLREAEVAALLGLSTRTVRRDWEKARLVLALSLQQ